MHKALLGLLVGSLRGAIVARTRKSPHHLGVSFSVAFQVILDQVVDSLPNETTIVEEKKEMATDG